MRRSSGISPLAIIFLIIIFAGVVLSVVELVNFSRLRATLPAGMTIANVPVGGLDRQQAAQRLLSAYTTPIEIVYNDQRIHLDPAVIEFELDLESMLTAAYQQRAETNFWVDYWDYLWSRPTANQNVPLSASFSEARLRQYLANEIATRYDQPATPAQPAVGTVNFQPGQPGLELDIDRAVTLIDVAMRSTSNRTVNLPIGRVQPNRPSMQNLEVLLKQTIDLSGFDGISGVYLLDLQTAQEINFLYRQGEELSTQPDLSFTGASIIKIPILVSSFVHIGDNPDEETLNLIFQMIDLSGNEASDWLMDRVITTANRPGPLVVTDDMQQLGLQNTFLAGYFYNGAPLLQRYSTPGNSRSDVNTEPDQYNQTSPIDIGMLLADIYHCANIGGGSLVAAFPGQITQTECQIMIDYLSRNRIGALIEAGTPDGTKIAHKHGWVADFFGVIRTIGDAGIVYTPGGDYVLVIFLNHPVQLVWENSSALVADLSRAVYNYYNLPQQ